MYRHKAHYYGDNILSNLKIAIVAMSFMLISCAGTSGIQGGDTGQSSISDSLTSAAFSRFFFGRGKAGSSGTNLEAEASYVWSQKMENQKRQMQATTTGTNIHVSKTADNRLKLNIPSDIAFEAGDARIKPDLLPILDNFAESLIRNSDTYITIIGHTDNSNNDVINNALSFDHAANTRDYLIRKGVLSQRISITGRGSHDPVVTDSTTTSGAINRRVEVFVFEL